MRKPIGLAIAGALVASGIAFVSLQDTANASPGVSKAVVPVPAGCTGGVVTNPSVEQVSGSSTVGFTKQGPGTFSGEGTYAYDGKRYAYVSSSNNQVTTAYQDVLPATAGGVYDLAFWGGTHNAQFQHVTGLRFLDASGAVLAEKSLQVDHDVDVDRKLQRYDLDGSVAPAGTAKVRFFASANGDYNKFDCVYLRVAAYDVLKEVQDPAGGQWLDADADPGTAGSNNSAAPTLASGTTAKYRVTVTNLGTQPLSNITPADPWCTSPLTGQVGIPFALAKGETQVFTCDHAAVTIADNGHVNTVTVSKVTYPQGSVPDKSEKAKIEVVSINKLGDFVWIDQNRDGLQDSGEPGVSGVKVTLQKADGTPVGTPATTDANGKYLFDKLPDGSYRVCFDVAALPAAVADYQVTKSNAGDDGKDSDADPATGCTEPVTLNVDTPENLTLDAGLVSPLNRLGDLVWVDTDKNGLQNDGEPGVPGVSVVAKNSAGAEVGSATTDENGNYLIDGLVDGSYQVCFNATALPGAFADYVLTQANVAGGNDAKDSDADPATGCTQFVDLGAGTRENLTLDAGIVSPPNRLGDFVWVDTNKNGLQDSGEPGVAGVSVVVKNAEGAEVGSTTTDGTGMYKFDNLPDGSFTVCFGLSALPAAYADYQVTTPNAGADNIDSDADPASGCAEPVELGPGKRENLTVDAGIVSPTNRLGDYVWVDTNKNGLQGSGEPGVPGVSVVAKNADGAEVGTATTDDSGKYLIDNLTDGTYTVCFGTSALPAAYAGYQVTQVNAGDDAKDSDADPATGCAEPVELGIGKRENLTLDAGLVSPPNKLGDLVWVDTNKNGIQDAGEPGVAGVSVVVKDAAGAEVGTTTTDGTGKYLFDNLPDGSFTVCFGLSALPAAYSDYQVTQVNAGDDAKDSDADPATGCAEPVELGVGKRENLTVDAGIVSPTNRLGDYVWVDTNKNGIQDADEPSVPGVSVVAKRPDGSEAGTATTDDSGKYLIDNLPDGTYSVCFGTSALPAAYADYVLTQTNAGTDDAKDSDADSATGCTEPVELGIGKRENLTLDAGLVSPPNKLGDFVRVDTNKSGIQDSGEPGVPGVTVVVKNADGVEVGTTTTDGTGMYKFDNLPDGTFTVCFGLTSLPAAYADYQVTQANAGGEDATDSDADPATGCAEPVALGPGKRENLTVDAGIISPTNRLGDFVWVDSNKNGLQDDGEPGVAGVSVVAKNAAGAEVGTTTTDDSGKYLVDNLPDGTYTVCFGLTNLPAAYSDYQVTQANAGSDDAKDSDADPATGCTASTTLGIGKREDLTLDAGLVSPPNKLGDFVWVDTNKNGLQDDGEPGVAGVSVVVKGSAGAEVGTTTTDDTGKYLFDNLPDGSFTVCFGLSALPAAYADYQVTKPNAGEEVMDSDAYPTSGCTEPVNLGPGNRENLTVDAGIVSPTNRLGDYVWIDSNDNGLQDSGEPGVKGVTVVLRSGDAEVSRTTTDAGGLYLFDNLPDGGYRVCFDVKALPAAVADYRLTELDAGNDNGVDSDADPNGCTESVTLGVGKRENLTLDAGLVAPPNRLGDYVWVDANRNGVQDADEPGVEDVTVVLRSGDTEVSRTKTDSDGKYLFDKLPDGAYRVCFEVASVPADYAGYLLTKPNAGADGTDSDADPASGCTEPVTLGVGQRENLTLDAGIRPPNNLGDRVWVDTNRDGLQDQGEPGVSGVTVTLKAPSGTVIGTATTGTDGKYAFGKLPDGEYPVCFDRAKLPATYADYQLTKPNAGDDAMDSDADPGTWCTPPTVLSVDHPEDLTLDAGIVSPRNRIGDYVWIDTNRNGVQDPGEPAAPGVPVLLFDPTGKELGKTTTDKAGKYLFDGLPDGTYQVCFRGTLPVALSEYALTKAKLGGSDAVDSDADQATGCTRQVAVGPNQREILLLDAGLVAPQPAPAAAATPPSALPGTGAR